MNRFIDDAQNPNANIDFYQNYKDYPYFHDHDYWEFFIVTKGKYRHVINNKTYNMFINQAFLIRPNDYHALFNIDNDSTHINIMIKSDFLKKLCDSYSLNFYDMLNNHKELFVMLSDSQTRRIINYTSLLKEDKNKDNKELISNLLLSYIIEKTITSNELFLEESPKWLTDIIYKINQPININWTVNDVLKISNYSHTQFARLFKKYMNCTLKQYLTKVKMSAAHDLLFHSDMNMQDISAYLGYSSLSLFNHAFKDYFSVSPSTYKKQINQK